MAAVQTTKATIAAKTTAINDPAPILLAAPVKVLGDGVPLAITPPAAEVASTELTTGDTNTKLTLGSATPVPMAPLDEADPVGYGATGVATTVAVDLITLTVR